MRSNPNADTASSQHRVDWMADSLSTLRSFPAEVREVVGQALRTAQQGGKHRDAKPLKGYPGTNVLEIVAPFSGNTYRVIYAVMTPNATTITVLHAFQKKSHSGIKTPRAEIDLVRRRLRFANSQESEGGSRGGRSSHRAREW